MTKLDERGAHAAAELRRELLSVPVPEPTRLVRRARHTRIVTATVTALVLGIGSLAVARAVDSHSSTRLSTGNQPPTPLDAPLIQGPDAASTLLTSWGELDVGYVFVYADGRVIWHSDGFPFVGPVVLGDRERRLSPRGLQLIRA